MHSLFPILFRQIIIIIIYFHAQIVTNLLFFPHHSLSTFLYSGTRCFWHFLLLRQPCNHLFFQGSLVLFSGQQYIETKIWMLGVPVALRISLPSFLSVIRTMSSDWYLSFQSDTTGFTPYFFLSVFFFTGNEKPGFCNS